jgi:hypothetical protein
LAAASGGGQWAPSGFFLSIAGIQPSTLMKSLASSDHETMLLSDSLASVFGNANGYLRIEWHTVPMVSTAVRRLFGQILPLLREEHLHRVFTERTTAPPLNLKDCYWLALEWMPQAAREAGLTHCAVVESQEAIDSRSARMLQLYHGDHKLRCRFFDSFAQAEGWIRKAA